ncbi:MAG TPA: glycine cleavage system aminomethyltransferase GcvT [Pseudomonadales bacterium]|nr:glycine cleavage system aminomethyltransferase GcvT [Pseudomonadales bacterium]
MAERTPLYDNHLAAGAKVVDFHGWDMPLHYGSQLEEHHAVRRDAGMFDVSHMTVVDIGGAGALDWLRVLVANDPARLAEAGRAQYTAMLDDHGGVIDDLIVYRRAEGWRLVVNSATREKDLAWMRTRLPEDVQLTERPDLAMIAVQGPRALERARAWLGDAADAVTALGLFRFLETGPADGDRFIARTGYTGEDGFEVILPGADAGAAWEALRAAGVQPAGLGARDTLRLEAGLNLYGQDMDETTTPLESNLAWTVQWKPEDRAFCGRTVLERQRAEGVPRRLVGLLLEARGVLRAHQKVIVDGRAVGTLTSGAFSPTLGCGIGLARIDSAALDAAGGRVGVEIRGKVLDARVIKPPFVRNGVSQVD